MILSSATAHDVGDAVNGFIATRKALTRLREAFISGFLAKQ